MERVPPSKPQAADGTTIDATLPAAAPGDAYLEPGTQLGEYRVEGPIGQGGMGVVYAAVHPLIGKRAAVKVLRPELCRSPFSIERFIDEARVVNQIGHPNIVDIFAFGQTDDGRSYLVMEWLRGETLHARCARSELDLDEICELIRPLLRALQAAHAQGVVHRDLKPDNVFLVEVSGEAPLVKLLDFGIAKLAREEHRMERTATGAIVGTPQYLAPEQAKGKAVDHRADIYALGGIMFELLTGRPPYLADSAIEVVAKHLMEAVPRPSSIAFVPPELDDLVVRMLAKDPAARPTLAEVSEVIERTSARDRTKDTRPVAPPADAPAAPEPAPEPPSPSGARRRGMRWKAMVALAFPVALVGAFLAVRGRDDARERIEARERIDAAADNAARALEDLAARTPVAAPIAPPPAAPPAPVVAAKVDPPDAAPVDSDADVKADAAESARPSVKGKLREGATRQPKPTLGRLILNIRGATKPKILIDGKPRTAVTVLEPGDHEVEVSSEGTSIWRYIVKIKEGETQTHSVNLSPIEPRL